MSAPTSIRHDQGFRIVEHHQTPSHSHTIDVILVGETYPIIRATCPTGRWLIMAGPEVARLVSPEFRFPPTLYADSERDARTWVELLANLFTKAAAA